MTVDWQSNADDRIATAENQYLQFKAWQSDNPVDNCWCLDIWQNADQEPIKVCALQSLKAVGEFVRGFLKDSNFRKTCEKRSMAS
jgi:hypothetical protein